MIKLLYFARLKEDLGSSDEQLELTDAIKTTGALREHLSLRGDNWHKALHMDGLFVAIDQEVSDWNSPLNGDEEVAFFPPVTGG